MYTGLKLCRFDLETVMQLEYLHKLHALYIQRLAWWRSPEDIRELSDQCTIISKEIAREVDKNDRTI
jgi:hypothetical protein